ncbi:hypothetical protein ACTQ5R_09360 [Ruoffia tabacinasalis]|uniref:hypothetical protein n=1 Tax=Ruoffia tabacinasalis TaxID=87458 RepID=UPI003F98CCFF
MTTELLSIIEISIIGLTFLATVISGISNFLYTRHVNNKQMSQERELSLLNYYDKKYNSLYKIMLIYRENDINKQDTINSIKLGYDYHSIYDGNGLKNEYVNELVSTFKNSEYIFDIDIIKAFDVYLNDFYDGVRDRYEQEESNPEIARENESFYFYEFDNEREFYNLIEEKMNLYTEKLN